MAGVLVDDVAVEPRHRAHRRPRLRVDGRILDGEPVVDLVGADAAVPLDRLRVPRRREPVHGLVAEVGGLDHQGVAVPVGARVPVPLADAVVEPRAPVDGDDAHVVDVLDPDRDVGRRLQYLVGVVVAGRDRRHPVVGDAPVPVAAVEPRVGGVVAQVGAPRRLRLDRLGPGRQPAVRRVDDERRPHVRTHPAAVEPQRVVRPHAPRRGFPVEGDGEVPLGRLLGREELLVGHRLRPLERRQRRVRPGAHQVRVAPRGPKLVLSGRLARGRRRQQQRRRHRRERRNSSPAHLEPPGLGVRGIYLSCRPARPSATRAAPARGRRSSRTSAARARGRGRSSRSSWHAGTRRRRPAARRRPRR